jgi:RNA polymerase sporulation-specific sigma factor
VRLQDYLAEVTKIKLLDPAEERTLWERYKQQQDLDSRRRLIEHYQPLVVKALARWRGNDAIMMDLVQEGTIGLIESVENYDHERGVAFSLYAIHRIRGRMLNYLEKEAKTAQLSIDSVWESEEGLIFADTVADGSVSVAETAERNFLVNQLRLAMGRLPNKERLALNGVFIEEQEPRHVASSLQISPSHLYRLQKQGIRRVRGMLSRLMAEMKK